SRSRRSAGARPPAMARSRCSPVAQALPGRSALLADSRRSRSSFPRTAWSAPTVRQGNTARTQSTSAISSTSRRARQSEPPTESGRGFTATSEAYSLWSVLGRLLGTEAGQRAHLHLGGQLTGLGRSAGDG